MRRDQEIFDLIEMEHKRQLKGMELIASENFVSDEVMQAMGSYLTTSMLKVTQANAIMVVVKWLTKLKHLPLSA